MQGLADTIELIRSCNFMDLYDGDPEDDDFVSGETVLPPLLTDNQS